jgi:hypothetical protein
MQLFKESEVKRLADRIKKKKEREEAEKENQKLVKARADAKKYGSAATVKDPKEFETVPEKPGGIIYRSKAVTEFGVSALLLLSLAPTFTLV